VFVKRSVPNRHSVQLRILLETRSCWLHLAAISALSLLSLPLTLLSPIPLKIAVDGLMGKPALPPSLQRFLPASYSHGSALGLAIGLLIALAILVNLQGLLGWWLWWG